MIGRRLGECQRLGRRARASRPPWRHRACIVHEAMRLSAGGGGRSAVPAAERVVDMAPVGAAECPRNVRKQAGLGGPKEIFSRREFFLFTVVRDVAGCLRWLKATDRKSHATVCRGSPPRPS